MRNAVRVILSVSLFVLFFVPAADAQYFGRNRVQWESFDFKVLQTEHFDIYYYDQEADVVNDVGRMAERWYARLSRVFNHSFKRKPIVLYANAADFHQTTTTGGPLGEGTGGFTDAFMNRVVLPLTGDYAENDHVLGHEMVHVFQYDIAATAAQNRRRFALEQMPLWIIEGMAEYFSKGRVDPLTALWIRDAVIYDRLPDIRQITRDPRYFPYRYGQAIMAYIGARFGDEAVVRYFMAAGVVGIEEGVERAVGITAKQLFTDWKQSARELYQPVIDSRPETLGDPLIGRKPVIGAKRGRQQGELNIGPTISPDGRYVAFLSARELFSINLYLADAHTGKVIRRLVSSDRDAHFESLRFIEAAGSWSPDSRRLAFITFAKGDNYLSLVDVETRNIEHIKVPGLEAIMNVAWSPDGRTIALAGQTTGVSDLFLYDLESKQVRRLTADKFADFHPAWSPDGRTIAFVSDRSSGTVLEQLQFTELSLATIDVASGQVNSIRVFDRAKHINPQWSPDGNAIYFIGNPEGVPDIYRYGRTDGSVTRVTTLRTGVAGITELAPAMSVSSRTGDIVFSVFEDDNHNVYKIAGNAPVSQTATQMPAGTPRAALLPPLRGTGSEITAYLNRPEEGLPAANTDFTERPYSADLKLAYLGPPTLGVGVGEYGFAAGGSVSAWFSDILGQHNIGMTFQGGGSSTASFQDQIGAEIFYLNQKHRLNWGADILRIPYLSQSNGYAFGPIEVDGQIINADQYITRTYVETVSDASALAHYPFSTTRRIEGAIGVQRYEFKIEDEIWVVVGNSIIDRQRNSFDVQSFTLSKASTAFVGDSSVFGFISPIAGTRYRYEVEALRGDFSFQAVTADWRKYFFLRPVTIAVRGLHYGRYGIDEGSANQLSPLYLGQGSIMRGYDPYSIDPTEECGADANCPVLSRLIGDKIATASIEVRAPLLGTRGYGLIDAPFVPTEIFAFGDIGAAWDDSGSLWQDGDELDLSWETRSNKRIPVASVGIGLRILLAYIPIEIYAAKPFQRPDEEIAYGFNIIPGW